MDSGYLVYQLSDQFLEPHNSGKEQTAGLFLLTLSTIDVKIMPGAEKGDLGLFALAVFMLSICCARKQDRKVLVFAGSE